MTIDEFFDELAKTPRTWVLRGDRIRCTFQGHLTCPVCRVAERPGFMALTAGIDLGLDPCEAGDLPAIADHSLQTIDDRISIPPRRAYLRCMRERMLKACGLS